MAHRMTLDDIRDTAKSVRSEYLAPVQQQAQEPLQEARGGKVGDTIAALKAAAEAASSFMGIGSELKKAKFKYSFNTEPLPIYLVNIGRDTYAMVNKKYASSSELVVGDVAIGKINEADDSGEPVPANAIWKQLGRIRPMIGAKEPLSIEGGRSLRFRIGRNAKSINWVRISLDPDDTYSLDFVRGQSKIVSSEEGVHADQLGDIIAHHTGMATRL